jgi:hypothetical protein
MTIYKTPLLQSLLIFLGLIAVLPQARADNVLWQSGRNQYIKLVDQEGDAAKPNDQPVTLDAKTVVNALKALRISGSYAKAEEMKTVFSTSQVQILGQYLVKGLQQARADQDIVFALAQRHRGFLNEETVSYLAGRAFYVDGKLNIIIGDYDRPADRFKERTSLSMGAGEVRYFFNNGSRDSKSGFKKSIITGDGISLHENRKNWLLVDVDTASSHYLTRRKKQATQEGNTADTEEARLEAARLAQERREMKLEMARMRKQMQEGSAAPKTVEERLQTLEDLKKKGLITEDEYKSKRQEILKDL